MRKRVVLPLLLVIATAFWPPLRNLALEAGSNALGRLEADFWGTLYYAAQKGSEAIGLGALLMFGALIVGLITDHAGESENTKNQTRPLDVEPFRENSPYGDAGIATRREISRALGGRTVNQAPQFED